ncbi:hypothetical protein V1477_003387 [Vespula maculifrons]|uniref:Maturase K n=1 Tax=Vespula maculifrons TaxID=7453 RepID=A0ABD2CVF7_VESMC
MNQHLRCSPKASNNCRGIQKFFQILCSEFTIMGDLKAKHDFWDFMITNSKNIAITNTNLNIQMKRLLEVTSDYTPIIFEIDQRAFKNQTIEFLERFHYAERWRKIYYCLIIRKKLLGQPNNYTNSDTTKCILKEYCSIKELQKIQLLSSQRKLVKFSLTRSNYTEKQHSFEILIIWEIGQKFVKYWFEDVFFPEVERLSSKSAMLIA